MLPTPPLDHGCPTGLRPVVPPAVCRYPRDVRRVEDFLLWLFFTFVLIHVHLVVFLFFFFFVYLLFFFFGLFFGILFNQLFGLFLNPAGISLVGKVWVSW